MYYVLLMYHQNVLCFVNVSSICIMFLLCISQNYISGFIIFISQDISGRIPTVWFFLQNPWKIWTNPPSAGAAGSAGGPGGRSPLGKQGGLEGGTPSRMQPLKLTLNEPNPQNARECPTPTESAVSGSERSFPTPKFSDFNTWHRFRTRPQNPSEAKDFADGRHIIYSLWFALYFSSHTGRVHMHIFFCLFY